MFDYYFTPSNSIIQVTKQTNLDNLMVAFPDQKNREAAREREREKF